MFWNITRRQAISAVGKFCHVLGRGFVIQRVIFIFIKSLSDNQNPLLYMKVLYYHQIVTAAVAQSVRAFACQARQHYKRIPSVTVSVIR